MQNQMNDDREILIRLLEGSLSSEEERGLREKLDADASLRVSLERLRAVRDELQGARAASFPLGFGERVMRRLDTAESGDDAFYRTLGWMFRRAAIASLIAATLFGAMNLAEYQELEVSDSVIESIFGLPTVTLDYALMIEPV